MAELTLKAKEKRLTGLNEPLNDLIVQKLFEEET